MNDCKRINLPIGFGNDSAIDGTRRILTTGSMIFHRVTHGEELVVSEPLAQVLVGHQDFTRIDMMPIPIELQAQIMVRGNDICHGLVGVVCSCQFEALANDCFGMIPLVASVKSIVLWQNLLLNIFF